MRAALANQVPAIVSLANHGADVNVADRAGSTALHHAAAMGHPAVVEMLMHLGADVMRANSVRAGPGPGVIAQCHVGVAEGCCVATSQGSQLAIDVAVYKERKLCCGLLQAARIEFISGLGDRLVQAVLDNDYEATLTVLHEMHVTPGTNLLHKSSKTGMHAMDTALYTPGDRSRITSLLRGEAARQAVTSSSLGDGERAPARSNTMCLTYTATRRACRYGCRRGQGLLRVGRPLPEVEQH
jgi:hypothetical protein